MLAVKSPKAFIAFEAKKINTFYGLDSQGLPTERAVVSAMASLNVGEILRLFIDQNPFAIIHQIALRFGSKIIFQYLQNKDGAVIIDFMKVRA